MFENSLKVKWTDADQNVDNTTLEDDQSLRDLGSEVRPLNLPPSETGPAVPYPFPPCSSPSIKANPMLRDRGTQKWIDYDGRNWIVI